MDARIIGFVLLIYFLSKLDLKNEAIFSIISIICVLFYFLHYRLTNIENYLREDYQQPKITNYFKKV